MRTPSRPANSPALHTPGPWRSHGAGGEIHGNSRVVATMTWCSGMGDEDDANARLVAAAPDMLDALEGLRAATDAFGREVDSETQNKFRTAWLIAGDAIARATGNSQ